jgi:urease accessory protein
MKKSLIAVASLLPLVALAHTGTDAGVHHGSALVDGFTHPFTGLDHMAAMIAVGVWSVLCFQHAGKRMLFVPAAFAALLLSGGLIGMAGMTLSLVEPMIAASLLVLGVLVALRVQMALPLGATIVGAFAVFHGLAHGAELPAAQAVSALSGMVAGTLLLHLGGMALGHFVLNRHRWLPRIAGFAVALFGAALLAA